MQLLIQQKLSSDLVLPISYHHILQSILYHNMRGFEGYSDLIHNKGYLYHNRSYRMFTFGPLIGRYSIVQDRIVFREEVSFEVRSPENRMIKTIAENIDKSGIRYPEHEVRKVTVTLSDTIVEQSHIKIRMVSPLSVYSTDGNTKKTHFYSPEEEAFSLQVNENFKRKYCAYTGIIPEEDIIIKPVAITSKDKYVTKYKGFYLSGWKGEYELTGERKHLDFLYQTGIGAKNSQGFGMFRLID